MIPVCLGCEPVIYRQRRSNYHVDLLDKGNNLESRLQLRANTPLCHQFTRPSVRPSVCSSVTVKVVSHRARMAIGHRAQGGNQKEER